MQSDSDGLVILNPTAPDPETNFGSYLLSGLAQAAGARAHAVHSVAMLGSGVLVVLGAGLLASRALRRFPRFRWLPAALAAVNSILYATLANQHLGSLLFAALYEKWLDPASSEWQRTFTILTTSANDVVAPVHDRMPVILDPDTVDEWLHIPASNAESHAQNVAALLRPAATETLIATAVSPRANSVANDDAECLLPFVADAPLQPALL